LSQSDKKKTRCHQTSSPGAAAVAAHLALERNMVPLDDWIGTYPIFLQVLLNIQDATPLKPGCNTTKTGMQHHKQRHKEGIIDVFFFETAKLMAAAAM